MSRVLQRIRVPWFLLAVTAALAVLGVLFLHSSTQGTYRDHLPARQLKSMLVAIPALLLCAVIPGRTLARLAYPCFWLVILLLLAVPWIGEEVNRARRWIAMPMGFMLQPSELAKPALVLAIARYLQFRKTPDRSRALLGPAALTLLPFLLVRAEPDLGTALLYFPILGVMLYVAGAPRRYFTLGAATVLAIVPLAYFTPLLKDYQKDRIRAYLHSIPELSAKAKEARREGKHEAAETLEEQSTALKRGVAYQSYCAQIAIGSGGVLGKGLGQGPQNRLSYLPERHNDFVFAVVGEEWGFLGGSLVIFLFLTLGGAILWTGARTRDRFQRQLCVGAAASLLSQSLGNIAMASGLLPTTGFPLPFFSQGGSSLLSTFLLLGLVMGVARQKHNPDVFLYPAGPTLDPFCLRSAMHERRA